MNPSQVVKEEVEEGEVATIKEVLKGKLINYILFLFLTDENPSKNLLRALSDILSIINSMVVHGKYC